MNDEAALPGRHAATSSSTRTDDTEGRGEKRKAAELLETKGALLSRSHLRELGLERRAIDAVFKQLAVVALPGYSRPLIRASDFVELVEASTYRDDRVRP